MTDIIKGTIIDKYLFSKIYKNIICFGFDNCIQKGTFFDNNNKILQFFDNYIFGLLKLFDIFKVYPINYIILILQFLFGIILFIITFIIILLTSPFVKSDLNFIYINNIYKKDSTKIGIILHVIIYYLIILLIFYGIYYGIKSLLKKNFNITYEKVLNESNNIEKFNNIVFELNNEKYNINNIDLQYNEINVLDKEKIFIKISLPDKSKIFKNFNNDDIYIYDNNNKSVGNLYDGFKLIYNRKKYELNNLSIYDNDKNELAYFEDSCNKDCAKITAKGLENLDIKYILIIYGFFNLLKKLLVK